MNYEHSHLPNPERLATVTGIILVTFTMAHFIELSGRELSIQFPGLYFNVQVRIQDLVALLIASLTLSGTDWLLRSHPHLAKKSLVEHWLLPGVTAWSIGVPLLQMPLSIIWWIGFILGGALLVMVLIAEYIAVDPMDLRQSLAAATLTAVAFSLYLVLISSLRFSGMRLFLLLPFLALAGFLVSLRTLRLRQPRTWAYLEAGLVTFITVQIATPLHYWPLSPVSFGLALLGPAYALTTFLGNIKKGENPRRAFIEPAVFLALIWGAAILVR